MCKPKILLVDDQPENLQILIETLKDKYATVVATSGLKALELLSNQEKPDLVLLDIIMPDINGFEVCRRMKSDTKTADIPVIFVTVMEAVEDIMLGFQLGGVDYIVKPYRTLELKARIDAHIKLRLQTKKLETLVKELSAAQALNLEQARVNASGKLIQNIAHQWRQPLTAVMLDIESIIESQEHGELEQERLKTQLENMKKSIHRMSGMISSFGSLFRPKEQEGGFDAAGALQNAISFVKHELDEKNIAINCDIDDTCVIKGFENEYTRVIITILSNAIEAIEKRGVKNGQISIVMRKNGDKIEISLKDNGGGIDEQFLNSLFEPYISSKFASSGVGLSLFVSKMLIEKHMGGEMKAKNIDNGAEFIINV